MRDCCRAPITATPFIALLCGMLLFQGCATMGQHKETTTGCITGATGGAILGGLIALATGRHDALAKTLIGAGAGAAAGLAAGCTMGKTIEDRHRSREEAITQVGYHPDSGESLIEISDMSAELKGESLIVSSDYNYLTPEESNGWVAEDYEVTHEGKPVIQLHRVRDLPNGGYRHSVNLDMVGMAKGTYEVTSVVSIGEKASRFDPVKFIVK
jgi:hypothetical protein